MTGMTYNVTTYSVWVTSPAVSWGRAEGGLHRRERPGATAGHRVFAGPCRVLLLRHALSKAGPGWTSPAVIARQPARPILDTSGRRVRADLHLWHREGPLERRRGRGGVHQARRERDVPAPARHLLGGGGRDALRHPVQRGQRDVFVSRRRGCRAIHGLAGRRVQHLVRPRDLWRWSSSSQ